MIITPSNTGSLIAGAGLGIFGWSIALEGDKIPFIKRFYTAERKESLFKWANAHKTLALLYLEAVNFGIHGITSANGVIFALGNTLVNVLGLWVFLPIRQRSYSRTQVKSILQGVKTA